MARIQFAAMVEEILGKLAGSVFQDSYLGVQIRGWSKPRNPQTQLSQLRRGDFRFLSSNWRNLTSTQKQTFIDESGTVPEAMRLFIGNNINLILIEEPTIDLFIPNALPPWMSLSIIVCSPDYFLVIASSSTITVPIGTKLLLFATTDKLPTKIFTNPSEYEPIISFDEGTDFSAPINIADAWRDHYGAMRIDRRICIKTAVILKQNGNRSQEFISCSLTTIMETLQQAFDASILAGDDPVITMATDNPDQNFTVYLTSVDETIASVLTIRSGEINIFSGTTDSLQGCGIHFLPDGTMRLTSLAGYFEIIGLIDAVDDAAAAAAGVPLQGLYHNAGAVRIRIS